MRDHVFEPHPKMGNVCRHCRGPKSADHHLQALKPAKGKTKKPTAKQLADLAAKSRADPFETRLLPEPKPQPKVQLCKHGEQAWSCIECEIEKMPPAPKRPLPVQNTEHMFLLTPVQQYFRGLTIAEAQKLRKGDKLFFRSIRDEALPCTVDDAPQLNAKNKNAVAVTLRRKYQRRFDFGTEVWRYDEYDIVDNRLLTEVSKNGKR